MQHAARCALHAYNNQARPLGLSGSTRPPPPTPSRAMPLPRRACERGGSGGGRGGGNGEGWGKVGRRVCQRSSGWGWGFGRFGVGMTGWQRDSLGSPPGPLPGPRGRAPVLRRPPLGWACEGSNLTKLLGAPLPHAATCGGDGSLQVSKCLSLFRRCLSLPEPIPPPRTFHLSSPPPGPSSRGSHWAR